MNDLDAVEVLGPDIRAACAGVIDRNPGVTGFDQLVSDVTLRILDDDLTDSILYLGYEGSGGERQWWIQGIAHRIIREHLAEHERIKENNGG